jgi:predicted DNA-binding transcriptional regulator AlpA
MSEASIDSGKKRAPKRENPLTTEQRDTFTVTEFCSRNCISRAHFYNLREAGQAPRMVKAGRRTLITREAEHDWHHAMEK